MNGPIPRGVPWISWDEWLRVMNGLFHNSAECGHDIQQTTALQTVSVWRARGKIPHSVDSTAQLINITRKDSDSIAQDIEFRSLYSFAIIRAINGLVDQLQMQYYADSIYNLANKIDLPGWLVEIRHDATHNELPSISILRSASSKMIAWFYEHYWCPQLNHIQSLTQSLLESQLAAGIELTNGVNERNMFEENLSHSLITHLLLPLIIDSALPESFSSLSSTTPATTTDISTIQLSTSTHVNVLSSWRKTIDKLLLLYPYLMDWIICHMLNAIHLNEIIDFITATSAAKTTTTAAAAAATITTTPRPSPTTPPSRKRNIEEIQSKLIFFKEWLNLSLKADQDHPLTMISSTPNESLKIRSEFSSANRPFCLSILTNLSNNICTYLLFNVLNRKCGNHATIDDAAIDDDDDEVLKGINDDLKIECIDRLYVYFNNNNNNNNNSIVNDKYQSIKNQSSFASHNITTKNSKVITTTTTTSTTNDDDDDDVIVLQSSKADTCHKKRKLKGDEVMMNHRAINQSLNAATSFDSNSNNSNHSYDNNTNNTSNMINASSTIPYEYNGFSLPMTSKFIKSSPIWPIGLVPYSLENSKLLLITKIE